MATSFLDLPGELRNRIYQLYLRSRVHTQSVKFCSGERQMMPPPLAYTSRQIRTELTSYISKKRINMTGIHFTQARVYNLDFEPLKAFLKQAERAWPLWSLRITLVFTERWRPSKTQGRLDEWFEWLEEGWHRPVKFVKYSVIAHWGGVTVRRTGLMGHVTVRLEQHREKVDEIVGEVTEARNVAETGEVTSDWAVERWS